MFCSLDSTPLSSIAYLVIGVRRGETQVKLPFLSNLYLISRL